MEITFRKLNNTEEDYEKLYKWCKNRYIYEWFEQRVLSLDEIKTKYMNKLLNSDQTLFIIQCDGNDIGLVQAYKYDDDIDIPVLNKYIANKIENTGKYRVFLPQTVSPIKVNDEYEKLCRNQLFDRFLKEHTDK